MKTKKVAFLILGVILLLLIVVLVITRTGEEEAETKKESPVYKATTYEERGMSVKESLARRLNVPETEIDVFIARESEQHMNGLFFMEGVSSGIFLAVVDNSIDIVWAGEGGIDCSVVHAYNFPKEMAPKCF
jgi:hypothetical protein